MSEKSNEAVYRRIIEEAFNKGNLAVVDELVSQDAIEHQRGSKPGRDGVKQTVRFLRTAFPDFTITIAELVADGDKIWARQHGGGTNLGSFFGQPPTGRKVFTEVFDVCRFENGLMVEHWGVPDQLGILLELGLVSIPRPMAPAHS